MATAPPITIPVVAPNQLAIQGINQVYQHAQKKGPIMVPVQFNLGQFNSDFRKFEQSLDAATARVVAFTATTSLLYGVGNAIQRLVSDAIKIESVMVRIQAIFGSTADETKQFQKEIFNLANATSTSFYQVAEAAEEFSRQGLDLAKTLDATRAAIVIAKLSGTDLQKTIEGLTATLSTFDDATLDYIDVANKLVALDAAFATSAGGITEGLKRVAGVASQAGLSFDETAAAITSLKQVTGRSESVIGNSLKSIFTSLQTEKIQKELNSLGVETQDATGEFRNLLDVLSDLSKVYTTLGDAQKALIAQKIGKTYQANAFQGILKAFESGNFSKALDISKNADDEGLTRIEKINQTTESALTRFSNNITKLGGNIGEKLGKPILETVVGVFDQIVDAANNVFGDSDFKGKIEKQFDVGDAVLSGLKNAISGPGLTLLTASVVKLFGRISREFAQAIGSVAGLNAKAESLRKIEEFITNTLQQQNAAELKRIDSLSSVEAKQAAILKLVEQQLIVSKAISSLPVAGPAVARYGLSSADPLNVNRIGRKIPNKAGGHIDAAFLKEMIDIQSGVGGARKNAKPMLKYLDLGKGKEPVVVNSDEKVIKNFLGSGQDAILNRKMLGYAEGKLTKKQLKVLEEKNLEKFINSEVGRFLTGKKNLKSVEGDLYKGVAQLRTPNLISQQGSLKISLGNSPLSNLLEQAKKKIPPIIPKIQLKTTSSVLEGRLPSHLAESINQQRNQEFSSIIPLIDKKLSFLEKEAIESRAGGQYAQSGAPVAKSSEATLKAIKDRNRAVRQEFDRIKFKGIRADDARKASTVTYGAGSSPLRLSQGGGVGRFLTSSNFYGGGTSTSSTGGRTSFGPAIMPIQGLRNRRGGFVPGSPNYPSTALSPIGAYSPYSPVQPVYGPFNQNPAAASPYASIRGAASRLPQTHPVSIAQLSSKVFRGGGNIGYFGGLSKQERQFLKDPNNVGRLSQSAQGSILARRQRLESARSPLNIGFATSLIGGTAASFATDAQGNPTDTSRRIEGASQALGSGAILGAFGKLPGILGLAVGSLVAVNKVFAEGTDQYTKYSKDHDNLTKKISSEAEALQKYTENFNDLSDAIAEGSEVKVKRATGNLTESLSRITDPGLRSRLSGATSLEDIGNITTAQQAIDKKRLESSAVSANLGKIIAEKYTKGGINKILTGNLGKTADIFGAVGFDSGESFFRNQDKRFGKPKLDTPDRETIAQQIVETMDFSRLGASDLSRIKEKGVSASDFTGESLKTLKLLADTFGNLDQILAELTNQVVRFSEKSKEAQGESKKLVQQMQNLSTLQGLVARSFQRGLVESLEKSLKQSSGLSLAEKRLELNQGFVSPEAYAGASAKIQQGRSDLGFQSQLQAINKTISEKAQKLVSEGNVSYDKFDLLNKSTGNFSKTGDIGQFIKSFDEILGKGGSAKLEKIALEELVAIQQIVSEQKQTRQDNNNNLKLQIEAIKQSRRASLYGGNNLLGRFDSSQTSGGLGAVLSGFSKNRFDDPNAKGFGRNQYNIGAQGSEARRVLDANVGGADAVIRRALYLKESGSLPSTGEYAAIEKKRLEEAIETKLRLFQSDFTRGETGQYIKQINKDSKRVTGGIGITGAQQKEISNLINLGKYGEAADLVGGATAGLSGKYILGGKNKELESLQGLVSFLRESELRNKDISLAAKEQTDRIFPVDKIDEQTKNLININTGIGQSNAFLSSINSLLDAQQKKIESDALTVRKSDLTSKIASNEAGIQANNLQRIQGVKSLQSSLMEAGIFANTSSDTTADLRKRVSFHASLREGGPSSIKERAEQFSKSFGEESLLENLINKSSQGAVGGSIDYLKEIEKAAGGKFSANDTSSNFDNLLEAIDAKSNDKLLKEQEALKSQLQQINDTLKSLMPTINDPSKTSSQTAGIDVKVTVQGAEFAEQMTNRIAQAVNNAAKDVISEAFSNGTGKRPILAPEMIA